MSTWILLRGLTRESGHWGRFPELLRAQMPDARVLAIDLPGNGRLNDAASPVDIAATMAHCRRQVQALGIAPPYRLLAMSLGGMVAVEWAAHHADELDACVLVNTSMRPFSPWFHRLRPATYGALLRMVFATRSHRAREEIVLQLTSRHLHAGDPVIEAWTALRDAHPVSRSNALRQLLAAARYRAPADAPDVPLLVLASRCDALVDVRCSRRLAHAWHAELAEHSGAGHDLALDDGPWLAAQVARWAARH